MFVFKRLHILAIKGHHQEQVSKKQGSQILPSFLFIRVWWWVLKIETCGIIQRQMLYFRRFADRASQYIYLSN